MTIQSRWSKFRSLITAVGEQRLQKGKHYRTVCAMTRSRLTSKAKHTLAGTIGLDTTTGDTHPRQVRVPQVPEEMQAGQRPHRSDHSRGYLCSGPASLQATSLCYRCLRLIALTARRRDRTDPWCRGKVIGSISNRRKSGAVPGNYGSVFRLRVMIR